MKYINAHEKVGITIISLIISIIIILILSSILISFGYNVPNNANFAKYTHQIDGIQTAIHDEYTKAISYNSANNITRTEEQVYYNIATRNEVDINTDVSVFKAGTIEQLNYYIKPAPLNGRNFFEVSLNNTFSGKKDNKGFYSKLGTEEKHYLTDKGEFFILPGYKAINEGVTKWFINANKFYISDTPITLDAVDNTVIYFNPNGGYVSEEIRKVDEGSTIGTLPIPTKSGYIFDGWYTMQTGGDPITSEITMGNETVTYYAHWKEALLEINGVFYDTIQSAFDSITPNTKTTVRLNSNCSANITIPKGADVIIDLQGKTLSNNENNAVITNNGNLVIENGTITSSATSYAIIDNLDKGNIVIKSGSLIATGNRQAVYNNTGGTVEITGNAFLSSDTTERATVQNQSGATLIVSGGTIISYKQAGINNSGLMTIGKNDDIIDTKTPIIRGKTYGINSSTIFDFYDGITKGGTRGINNESNINETENDSKIIHGVETIDDVDYNTTYIISSSNLVTVYEHVNDYEFNGTSDTLNTGLTLFSLENIHKDFIVSFTIKDYTITGVTQPTILNLKDESGSPYNGICLRLKTNEKTLEFSAKGYKSNQNHSSLAKIDNDMRIEIERKQNVISLKQNDTLICTYNYTDFNKYFNTPLTIGSSYKDGPFRYFKGTLSDIIIQVEQ